MLNQLGRYGHTRRSAISLIGLVLLLIACLGVVPGWAAAPKPPPGPAPKATWGIGPGSAKGVDGRSFLNYDASPGATLDDHIVVHNYAANPLQLLIYAADASTTQDGSFAYAPRSAPGTDTSRWFRFASNATTIQLNLNPSQTAIIPISVHIPSDASPGDHVAGVMAGSQAKIVTNGGPTNVGLEQRVALRAFFRISGAIKPLLKIEHLKATYHDNFNPIGKGSASVSYTVRNAGNVMLGGTQKITISGLFGGTGAHVALAQVPLLLPGGSVKVSVRIRHVSPEFIMSAKVSVFPISAPSAVNPGLTTSKATASFWAIPWMLLLIILLVIGATVTSIIRGRGPRRRYSGGRRLSTEPEMAGRS